MQVNESTQIEDNKNLEDSKIDTETQEILDENPETKEQSLNIDFNNPENLEQIYQKLGKPDNLDNYELNKYDNLDENLTSWYRKNAFDLNLSQNQASKLYDNFAGLLENSEKEYQDLKLKQQHQELEHLKQEWGVNFKEKCNLAKIAAKNSGLNQDKIAQIEDAIGTASFTKLFSFFGNNIKQPKAMNDIFSDKGSMYKSNNVDSLVKDKEFLDKYLSGDKDAVNLMRQQFE